MKIVGGKIKMPLRAIIYGPEGIGKTEFGAQFPKPVFIDVEKGSYNIDVQRVKPTPTSWSMLMGYIDDFIKDHQGFETLIIDTIDWAERLCKDHVCSVGNKENLADFGYGRGNDLLFEEMGRFINRLNDLQESGMAIVILAHAALRKFEQPDEMGAYDRWELKLQQSKKTNISQLVKEWGDLVLFCNYETFAVKTDPDSKRTIAQGGKRVIYTSHHPCWDAKNRFGFPAKMDFPKDTAYKMIKAAMDKTSPVKGKATQQPTTKPSVQSKPKSEVKQESAKVDPKPEPAKVETKATPKYNSQLVDLMAQNEVTEAEIRYVVSHPPGGKPAYYPEKTPIENYAENFVKGVLIGAWEKVFACIEGYRIDKAIPF